MAAEVERQFLKEATIGQFKVQIPDTRFCIIEQMNKNVEKSRTKNEVNDLSVFLFLFLI
jgi:hypothetical protein